MKFAYADPPYPGMARKYRDQALCAEVNHRLLIAHLCDAFDAWALSTASVTLRAVLALCPSEVRIAAWVKPFSYWKPGVRLAYAWEPVILWRPRPRDRARGTVRDWVSANVAMRQGFVGAKPEAVATWIFEALGATPEDAFTDLFPGSGAVGRAWEAWKRSQEPPERGLRPLPAVARQRDRAEAVAPSGSSEGGRRSLRPRRGSRLGKNGSRKGALAAPLRRPGAVARRKAEASK